MPSSRVVRTWPSGRLPSRTEGSSASPSGDVAPTPGVASVPTSRRCRRFLATWSSERGCSGRSFWDEHGLRFESADERGDVRLVVRALLASRSLDVVPAVVYRWFSRGDNRSLHQRDLYDQDRVADRVRAIRIAGELLTDASDALRQTYFSEVLHTSVPDLVKAAVCRDDGYWNALHLELTNLLDIIPSATLDRVPVGDRITAWLCAQDERAATEEYLEYAFDNRNGFPFDLSDGRPRITLPFIDVLSTAPRGLTLVADADMRFRARLTRVRWVSEKVIRLEGAAFMEYLDDRCGESVVELVLIDKTGREVRVPTERCDGVRVNQWSTRANEDHSRSGFAVELDVTTLGTDPTSYEAWVDLRLAGFHRVGPFRSRNGAASPGLLERSRVDGTSYEPVWHEHRGLSFLVGMPRGGPRLPGPGPVVADTVSAKGSTLRIEGESEEAIWVSMVGPRAATEPVEAVRDGSRFHVELSLYDDEWGLAPTSLPANFYELKAHTKDGTELTVSCARSLWRELPYRIDSDEWTATPTVDPAGQVSVRVVPVEWTHSRPPFLRRTMRDNLYVESREKPLLDTVLFETFAGRGTGDNPGAICAEFARRGLDLDLVYSVIDRSNVPAGPAYAP